jgi:putative acetyltransferase
MHIRQYRETDAVAVAAIFVQAVTLTGLRGYSAEQVAAWASGDRSPAATHARCSDGRLVLVAVDNEDTPIAFIDLEDDGHIDMLFCAPQHGGRGLASALYARLEAAALSRRMKRLFVEASEIAKPFFASRGFALIRRKDFEVDGVPIHNYAMEKHL